MNSLMKIGVVLASALVSSPLIAGNPASEFNDFQALSSLPMAERQDLTLMSNTQLAAVEGAQSFSFSSGFGNMQICIGCNNIAVVVQNNISVGSFVSQINDAIIIQGIN